ncbi:Ras GTPase ras2 [Chytridiales sp. JEL 0842]|nr:Ras GTPase ras2 [Chytridiales sp. JEL 0842]
MLYRLVVLGDGGVGKTVIDDESCILEVLDTAGQEEYTALRDQWIRDGEAFILVYSITSRSTFDRIEKFKSQIKRVKDLPASGSSSTAIPMVLVGNKCDKVGEREVSREEGAHLAKKLRCEFFETSAKTCVNVERAFYQCVRQIRQQRGTSTPQKEKKKKYSTQYKCPRSLPIMDSANSTPPRWTSECREPEGKCKPAILIRFRGKMYLVLTCQWAYRGPLRMLYQYLNYCGEPHPPEIPLPLLFPHRHIILTQPARPLNVLASNFWQILTLLWDKDFTQLRYGIEYHAILSKDSLGVCNCISCMRRYSSYFDKSVLYRSEKWLLALFTPCLWAFCFWCSLSILYKPQGSLQLQPNQLVDLAAVQAPGSNIIVIPRILAQLLFFCVSRSAALAIFNITVQSTQTDRKRLMAYFLAGADPVQSILSPMLHNLFYPRTYGPSILAFFTDFWVLLVAVSSVGAAYVDVSISANRCGTAHCYLTLSETIWLAMCVLMSGVILVFYLTPTEILARHAFSEAAGTAAGFDIRDVMRYYTTRLVSVPDEKLKNTDEMTKKAHFQIVQAKLGEGWLIPDSFLVSETLFGEKVCGGGMRNGDGAEGESGNSVNLEASESSSILKEGIESSPAKDNVIDIEESKRLPGYESTEYRCPKFFDTGYCQMSCMESHCRQPIIKQVNGTPCTVLLCHYKGLSKTSYFFTPKNLAYLMNREYSIRHLHTHFSRTPGPIEALCTDCFFLYKLIVNSKLRTYMIETCFNRDIDQNALGKCKCCYCQPMYAQKSGSSIAINLLVRILLFCSAMYLIAATIVVIAVSAGIDESRQATFGYNVTLNKILFQALFFLLTRGASFSIAIVNLNVIGDRARLMAFLLACTDPISCILVKLLRAIIYNPRKYQKEILNFFTDFWLMVCIGVSLGASYADVTVSAARCTPQVCTVTSFELSLILVGAVTSLLISFHHCTPIRTLARHAFSEAAGTCGGYTMKNVMAYYTTQLRKVSDTEAHFAIVEAGECKGVTLVDAYIPKKTSLGQKIV